MNYSRCRLKDASRSPTKLWRSRAGLNLERKEFLRKRVFNGTRGQTMMKHLAPGSRQWVTDEASNRAKVCSVLLKQHDRGYRSDQESDVTTDEQSTGGAALRQPGRRHFHMDLSTDRDTPPHCRIATLPLLKAGPLVSCRVSTIWRWQVLYNCRSAVQNIQFRDQFNRLLVLINAYSIMIWYEHTPTCDLSILGRWTMLASYSFCRQLPITIPSENQIISTLEICPRV